MDAVIEAELAERLQIRDKLELYPWFLRRCRVRILMYADTAVQFDGGGFLGLQRVLQALGSDPWFWVQFTVTTAHRTTDPSADRQGVTLDALDLQNNFDQIWLFGFDDTAGGYLSGAELDAVHDFMDAGGGVLVTGDHEALGAGLASGVKRAGKMRLWTAADGAPSQSGGDRHETIQGGGSQSDATPQPIRLRTYPSFSFLRRAPHPVLCGPSGPIDILPDHMHEGEAVAPAPVDASEWPAGEAAEVVAWGRMTAGDGAGQEFGVVSVYDGHRAGVGRIVADSTWHHWFDINLLGFAAGSAVEQEIYAYYRNVAVWLSAARLQRCMRRRLCWNALYLDPLVMISPRLPLHVLGRTAIDAFGKYAPQCLIRSWWWPELVEIERLALFDELRGLDLPGVERLPEMVVGGVVRELRERFPAAEMPAGPPDEDAVERAFEGASTRAAEDLADQFLEVREHLIRMLG